jgi:S-adenosylmethionine/arginine decarboxylase-like enzyme
MEPILKHEHLLVRALIDRPFMEKQGAVCWIESLVSKLGLTFLHSPIAAYCHDKGNRGVTAVAILNASHVALHIWDETQPAVLQLDLYSCRSLDVGIVLSELDSLSATRIQHKMFDRSLVFQELTPDLRKRD